VGNFKIVANLPYAISSPWLAAVLAGPLPIAMVLMLQRETAERLRAPVGTKQFGALSVSLRAAYRVAGFHPVPGSCFAPEPEVESALLHLELLPEPASLAKRTRSLLRQIFQKRRKQIGSIAKTLKAHPEMREWLSILEKRGVPPTMRPEAIAIPHWLELDRLCRGVDRG
jgi:16S rRNA (adenine1518-N6/adenine1519-N6)-dimethyltransferase